MTPTFTLRTVTAGGALDRFLPDYESLDLSPVFCQAGTVKFKYPSSGVNFALLVEDTELAVLMDGVEIGQLRCIIEAVDGQDIAESEDGTLWEFTARTMLALLDRAVVYPKDWPATTPPSHDFGAATPGKILIDLLNKAQGRGALPGLTWDFTETRDSNGVLWTDWGAPFDIGFDAGIKYTDVVQNMVDDALVEVRTDKRVLQAFIVDSLGDDRSIGETPLRFTKGRDIREAPRKVSSREIATAVLLAGAEGIYTERTAVGAPSAIWGRRETYYSNNNATSTYLLSYMGEKVLSTMSRPKEEVTHGLLFSLPSNPRPIRDFDVGDWGLSDVGRGWERYRIKQWVISIDNQGLILGSVILNDLFADQTVKINSRLNKIANGTTSPGASEEKDEGKVPAKPGGLSISTDYYLDHNVSRAVITVDWAPVTTNTDGTLLSDLAGYRVRWRYQGEDIWRGSITTDTDETVWTFANVQNGRVVEAQVQAFNKYNRSSEWTGLISITTAHDTVPPEKPAPPEVTSRVGTLRVTWTGLDYQGQQQVADYAGVEVHVGPNGTFEPSEATLKDFLNTRSSSSITLIDGLEYYTEYWVRLVAVDTSGNRSPASDETETSHTVLSPVVNIEIGTGQIGLSNTVFSDIGNLVDDGSFENIGLRTSRQLAMFNSHMSFDNTTSSNGTWSLAVAGQTPWTPEELILQGDLPIKPGERVFGAADYRVSSDASVTSDLALIVRWYDKDRGLIDPDGAPGDASDYEVLTTNFTQVPLDGAWHERVNYASRTAPPGAASMDIILRCITHYSGTIWIDALEVRRQVDTLMIGEGVIQSAHIGLLQVNDAHMANVSIGKLTAGNLTADMTVSSRIKTSDAGARVEMNSAGIQAWNNAGAQTVDISSTTGSVSVVGQIKSGTSGRRVEVNSSGLPEIRFYPTSGSNFAFINATDNGTGTLAHLGMNSGQFSVNGVATTFRLLLSDDSSGGWLQTVDAATQARNGGSWAITSNYAGGTVYSGGRDHGYVKLYKEGNGGNAVVLGHTGSTAATEVKTEYRHDGTLKTTGRYEGNIVPSNNQAMVFQETRFASAITGFEWNWGVTALTTWLPQLQVRDQAAHAAAVEPLSASGFGTVYNVSTAGISYCHFLAWRM